MRLVEDGQFMHAGTRSTWRPPRVVSCPESRVAGEKLVKNAASALALRPKAPKAAHEAFQPSPHGRSRAHVFTLSLMSPA